MHKDRRLLRALLSALIAERGDADALYIPRGEAGMRRMIRALLAMRPAKADGDALEGMIEAFGQMEAVTAPDCPDSAKSP